MILFAAALVFGYSIVDLLIWAIIIAACVGIAFVAFRVFGVSPPPWAIQIFWICVVAAIAIIAIRFLASL